MSTLSRSQATTILRNLGWRIRTTTEYTAVVKRFQGGWNLGPALAVDGSVGPATSAALLLSESRRRAGKPTASAHFSFSEVACRCGGKFSELPTHLAEAQRLQDDGRLPLEDWSFSDGRLWVPLPQPQRSHRRLPDLPSSHRTCV